MEAVIRAIVIYVFLLLLFRIAGKRTLAEINSFDFVLLLIVSEATQQGLIGNDFSLVNAFILVAALIGLDIIISLLKQRWRGLEKVLDDVPLVIVENGKCMKERMDRSRVDEADVLEAARERQGLWKLEQIKYAVLERGGGISIIPMERR